MEMITRATIGTATAAGGTLLLVWFLAVLLGLWWATRPVRIGRRPAWVTWLVLPWLLHATVYYVVVLLLRARGVEIGDMPTTLYVTLWSTGLRSHALLIISVILVDYARGRAQ